MERNKKVIVGMSGGVDSSVAALLLLRQGYEVAGATFRLRDGSLPGAHDTDGDERDARAVCDKLGIPHYVLDFRELFRRQVVEYFAGSYRRGATPNPCVACNKAVKFGAFMDKAVEMGFDYIATGHYATVLYDGARGRYRLKRGACQEKDQSYVLYTLTQEQLSRTLMPLGNHSKEDVRVLAREAGLVVVNKAESQDICFVPDGDYRAFLDAYTGGRAEPGSFVDTDGNVLGQHRGIRHYTIGQRKGLGISFDKPMFVAAINPAANTVILAEHDALMSRELAAEDACFIDFDRLETPLRCAAKIRYAAKSDAAEIFPLEDGRVRVVFNLPQRAVTPGQAVVFYDGDFVVGGATIQLRYPGA